MPQLVAEGMAARMLAEHQRRLGQPDRFRRHDFVGAGELQHAVLMDAGLVREGVGADDRLVRLHREPRNRRRSEEHTSELQSLMRISYAVFCLKKKTNTAQRRIT